MAVIGYPSQNLTLAKQGIRDNRTCMLNDKHPNDMIKQARELCRQNIRDLFKIVEWNIAHDIRMYRISSDIAPQLSNWRALPESKKMDWRELTYDLWEFEADIVRVAELAKIHDHRLTFHPPPFVVLNAKNPFILTAVKRELWWHTLFFEIGKFPKKSTLTIHTGGIYGDKLSAIERFIKNYSGLDQRIKSRLILENDEDAFNIDDVIGISERCGIPVCFDYFHFLCYNKNRQKNPKKYFRQRALSAVIKFLRANRSDQTKLHYSEQAPGMRLGTHSNYIKNIPSWMFEFDLMVESKCKELSLRMKY